jgi:hypothetical protein
MQRPITAPTTTAYLVAFAKRFCVVLIQVGVALNTEESGLPSTYRASQSLLYSY